MMTTDDPAFIFGVTENEYLLAMDRSIRRAERILALEDVPDADDDPEAFDEAYERIFHCEVCTVREVLEVVWPAAQEYIDWLRSQIPEAPK
jgi:hypothetical protein